MKWSNVWSLGDTCSEITRKWVCTFCMWVLRDWGQPKGYWTLMTFDNLFLKELLFLGESKVWVVDHFRKRPYFAIWFALLHKGLNRYSSEEWLNFQPYPRGGEQFMEGKRGYLFNPDENPCRPSPLKIMAPQIEDFLISAYLHLNFQASFLLKNCERHSP